MSRCGLISRYFHVRAHSKISTPAMHSTCTNWCASHIHRNSVQLRVDRCTKQVQQPSSARAWFDRNTCTMQCHASVSRRASLVAEICRMAPSMSTLGSLATAYGANHKHASAPLASRACTPHPHPPAHPRRRDIASVRANAIDLSLRSTRA